MFSNPLVPHYTHSFLYSAPLHILFHLAHVCAHTHPLVKSNSSSILCLAKYEVLNVVDKTQNSGDRFHVIIMTMNLKWASSAVQQPTTFISSTDQLIYLTPTLWKDHFMHFFSTILFLLAKNFVSCFMEEMKSIRPELHPSPLPPPPPSHCICPWVLCVALKG